MRKPLQESKNGKKGKEPRIWEADKTREIQNVEKKTYKRFHWAPSMFREQIYGIQIINALQAFLPLSALICGVTPSAVSVVA